MWSYGLDPVGPGQRQVAGTCECGKKHSGSMTRGKFLDYLKTGEPFKKDSVPWSKYVGRQVGRQVDKYTPSFLINLMMAYQAETCCSINTGLNSCFFDWIYCRT